MTGDGHVTQRELAATIEPIQKGIENIEEVVKDIPLIREQVERTNGLVAENTKEIGEINKWRWMLSGGGVVITLTVGGGGLTFILMEVLK